LVGRVVRAGHPAARHARPQLHPVVASRQAQPATGRVRPDLADRTEMLASWCLPIRCDGGGCWCHPTIPFTLASSRWRIHRSSSKAHPPVEGNKEPQQSSSASPMNDQALATRSASAARLWLGVRWVGRRASSVAGGSDAGGWRAQSADTGPIVSAGVGCGPDRQLIGQADRGDVAARMGITISSEMDSAGSSCCSRNHGRLRVDAPRSATSRGGATSSFVSCASS